MPDEITKESVQKHNQWFAIECNNRAWDLIAKPDRTPDEDREMHAAAHASAWHWFKVGAALNDARAELLLAHVESLLRRGEIALDHAHRALEYFEHKGGADWDIAFAHLEMALAGSALKDAALHAKHYAEAQRLGMALEEEDRKVFEEEFGRVPVPV